MKKIWRSRNTLNQQYFSSILLLSAFIVALPASSFARAEDQQDTPAWVKRTEFSVRLESDQKPQFYLQTVQPLYQDNDKINTFFIQPRASIQAEHGTYNLGLGYRRLSSENFILGTNVFFDFEDEHRHGRMGLGVEALGQVLEARANAYFGGITNNVRSKTVSTGDIIERVADGADLEFGMPVPYMPWLKFYGSGFWYDYIKFDDRFGWKSRLEAKMNEAVRLEFFTWDDNKGDTEYGGRIRFNVAFGNPFEIKGAFQLSDEPFPKKDLSEELLIPVERDFNITVESYTESNGLIVEAGRS